MGGEAAVFCECDSVSIFSDWAEWLDGPGLLSVIHCALIIAHGLNFLAKWPFRETNIIPQPGNSIFGLELAAISALVSIPSYA